MSWTHFAYEAIAESARRYAGLLVRPSQTESAELAIRRAMARAGVADPVRYQTLVATRPDLRDCLVEELAVGETYFFREPGQFDLLRREILPGLRRRRGEGHVMRAWSAGCASGEEAYSLAILLDREGWGGRSHVLATDVSRRALARARRAVYTEWSLRDRGRELAGDYLRPAESRYTVDKRVRGRVTFAFLNLAEPVYPSPTTGTCGLDLVLCRNVLIYLDGATVAAVARRLFESLAEGGWLLTASADPPLTAEAPFETVITDWGVFYRRASAAGAVVPTTGPCEAPVAKDAEAPSPPAPLPQPSPPPPGAREQHGAGTLLAEARELLDRGEWAGVVRLTGEHLDDSAAVALHVRALANLDGGAAEAACARAAARHPLSTELHYLRAVLLVAQGNDEAALHTVRRVLDLDRSLAVGHFLLGSILFRQGDRDAARQAYGTARALSAALPVEEIVPLSDGERAGELAQAAAAQLEVLGAGGGAPA